MYNADQLEATCKQYIILNLPALFEGRLVLVPHVLYIDRTAEM